MKKIKLISLFLLLAAIIVSSLALSVFAEDTAVPEESAHESFIDAHKYYYDFETGSAPSGSLKYVRFDYNTTTALKAGDNAYLQIKPEVNGKIPKSDYLELTFPTSYKFADKTVDYVSFDFDVATDSEYINGLSFVFMGRTSSNDGAGGAKFQFTNLSDGFALTNSAGDILAPLGSATNEWTHLSFIIELNYENPNASPIHIYANGVYTKTLETGFIGENATASTFNAVRIQSVNTANAKTSQTAFFDNFSVRFISGKDSTVDGSLAKFLLQPENAIDSWSNSVWNADYVLPITKYAAMIGQASYESFSEAYTAAIEGDTITLLKPVSSKQSIEKKLKVDTSGLDFVFESSTLLATVNGTLLSFDAGEVTVNWILSNGTKLTEVYTSSLIPTYKGDNLTPIIKTYTPNGTMTVRINTGWAAEIDGKTSELGAVTNQNCNFYQITKVTDALFLTVDSSGNVTEYTTATQFRDIVSADSSLTFEVLSDIALENTISQRGQDVINLNGFELSLALEKHMFQLQNGASLTINGSGKINKTSTKSQVFIIAKGAVSTLTVNDTEIYSGAVLLNQKDGVVNFNNCALEMSGATSNNMFSLVGYGESVKPVLNVNGGSILFSPTANRAFNITVGSTANVSNCTIDSNNMVFNVDATSSINVEKCGITCTRLVTSGSALTVYLGLGVTLTFTQASSYNVPEGAILAYTNADYDYVLTDSYSNVVWVVGEKSFAEIWENGSIPVPSDETVSALEALNASNTDKTKIYYFDISEVNSDTEFEAITKLVVESLFNINLHSSIDMNIYVPVSENNATVTSIVFNGKDCTLSSLNQIQIGETVYYVLERGGISPSLAGTEISLSFTFKLDDVNYTLSTVTSVVDYCASIVEAGPDVFDEKLIKLSADLIRYCDKAAVYFEKQTDESYKNIKQYKELYAEHASKVTEIVPTGDIAGLKGKLKSARLILDSEPSVLFEIEPGFNGRITIRYMYNGEERADTYTIYNGKIGYGDKIYVPCSMASFDTPIRVEYSDGRLIGTYAVSNYCNSMKDKDPIMNNLLNALYAYCKSVESYIG